MDFWNRSSTGEKVALVVVIVALILGFIALGVFLFNLIGGGGEEAAAVPSPTPVTGEVAPTPPAPEGETPDSGAVVVGVKRETTVVIAVASTPVPGAPSVTANTNVNIRSGPGTQYPIIGVLGLEQTARVVGVSADGTWWAIDFPSGNDGQGWVSGEFVSATNTETVPVLEAPPVPAPTPTPPVIITDWRGEYFANRDLQGQPALTRNDQTLDFNWGYQPARRGHAG